MSVATVLNSNVHIEPIFVSLTKDNYISVLSRLKAGLQIDNKTYYDQPTIDKIEKYNWLVTNQLSGNVPSLNLLASEFPDLILNGVTPIVEDTHLFDYVTLFINQKKQQYLSSRFMNYADSVRSRGLTEDLVESIYKDLAISDVDTDYVDIADSYEAMYDKQVEMKGISFQCPELDELTGGITEGQLCTVLGASGSMKTTYTSNIAYGAVKQGKNVLYLTLEESPFQLYSKWLSRASVDLGKPLVVQDIVQHKLEKKDHDILLNEVKPYLDGLDGKIYFVGEQDLTSYSLTSLEALFKQMDNRAIKETGHGIDLLVVDHIQLIKFAVTNMDPTTVINMYVSFFRQQSLSWLHGKRSISVILLSQANRDGSNYAMKHDGQYLATHVAEASEVIRASAYIISVYTDAMIQVTKQLKVGAVKLRGSQLPATTITVFADGQYYQVGDDVIPEQTEYSMDSIGLSDTEYSIDDFEKSGILNDIVA